MGGAAPERPWRFPRDSPPSAGVHNCFSFQPDFSKSSVIAIVFCGGLGANEAIGGTFEYCTGGPHALFCGVACEPFPESPLPGLVRAPLFPAVVVLLGFGALDAGAFWGERGGLPPGGAGGG